MVDGGKDRARLFKKALEVKKVGKDKLRNVYKRIMLHSSEESVRTRRGRNRGSVKLTQGIHIIRNNSTCCEPASYAHYTGSTNSDILGPVVLDPMEDLPKLDAAAKNQYLGSHKVLIGGPDSQSEESEKSGDIEPGEKGDELAIHWHAGGTVLRVWHLET